jgi:hypothetical protein
MQKYNLTYFWQYVGQRQGRAKQSGVGQTSRPLEQYHMHMSSGEFAVGFICYSHPFLGFSWIWLHMSPFIYLSLFLITLLLKQYFWGLKGIKGVFKLGFKVLILD